MLILGRRRGERIIIETADGIITILPVMIDGEQIRIGIEAPGHIAVDREEVYRRKCGVFWHKRARKWQANVRLNGKYRYFGLFDDINEAAAVVSKFYAANGFTSRHGQALSADTRLPRLSWIGDNDESNDADSL